MLVRSVTYVLLFAVLVGLDNRTHALVASKPHDYKNKPQKHNLKSKPSRQRRNQVAAQLVSEVSDIQDLRRRIIAVEDALLEHEARREVNHIDGAKQVLLELQDELQELLSGKNAADLDSDLREESCTQLSCLKNAHEAENLIEEANPLSTIDGKRDNAKNTSDGPENNKKNLTPTTVHFVDEKQIRKDDKYELHIYNAIDDDDDYRLTEFTYNGRDNNGIQNDGSSSTAVEIPGAHDIIKNSDVLVVTTIDGHIYGIDANSGSKVWSFSAGKSVISSHQDNFGTSVMIPGTDGSIFQYSSGAKSRSTEKEMADANSDDMHNNGNSTNPKPNVQRFPLDVNELVSLFSLKAPVDASNFFMGEKTTTLFGLDAITGDLKFRLSAGESPDQILTSELTTVGLNVDDVKDSKSSETDINMRKRDNILWLGRTDYRVRLFDHSGSQKWNFSISQYDSPTSNIVHPTRWIRLF